MGTATTSSTILDRLLDLGCVPHDADSSPGSTGAIDFMGTCPAHDDGTPSLHYTRRADGFELIHCFAGCEQADVLTAIRYATPTGFLPRDFSADYDEPDVAFEITADVLSYYAKVKGLDVEWLQSVGVHSTADGGIGFGYWNAEGTRTQVRTRADATAPTKSGRGRDHELYGQWGLPTYHEQAVPRLFVTEGETDTLTLWQAGYPAVGIIGSNGYRPSRDDVHLAAFEEILIVPDNDDAGKKMAVKFAKGPLAHKVRVVSLPDGVKDVNVFYLLDPPTLRDRFEALVEAAAPVGQEASMSPLQFFNLDKREPVFVPKLLADALGAEFPFAVGEDGALLRCYDGVWYQDGDQWIESRATEWLGYLYEPEYVNKGVKFYRHAGSFNRVSFSPPHEERVVVHCANGIVDVLDAIETGEGYEPEPSTPERAWLAAIPWEYDPTATCPAIEEFFRQVLPVDAYEFWFELTGYGMQFRQTLRRALLMHGSGHNGKSIAAQYQGALYGWGNVSALSLARLTGDRFAASHLVGKLANVCADIGPTLPKDVGDFKMLTGGDWAYGERKYRDGFEFKSGAFPIFSCNTFPRTPDTTSSFFDRWIVVEFPHEFPEDAKEEARLKALAEDPDEMRGLFRLAIEGLARLTERGDFDPPPSSVAAKQMFIDANVGVI